MGSVSYGFKFKRKEEVEKKLERRIVQLLILFLTGRFSAEIMSEKAIIHGCLG